MVKFIFDLIGKRVVASWWSSLHHPSAFAIRYAFWCSFVILFLYAILAFDVPYKGKTVPELFIGNEVEQYRLHQNTEDWIVATSRHDKLKEECDYIRRQVERLQLVRWQLMAIQGMPTGKKEAEIDKATVALEGAKKKLLVADLALSEVAVLLKKLVAQR